MFYFWTSLHVLCPRRGEYTAPKELSQSHRHAVGWGYTCKPRLWPSLHSPPYNLISVRHCVQSERSSVLFGPQTQVLDAGGLIVVAGEATCSRCLQQRAVPHLLCMMGQGLVVGLAGQRAQRRGGHVNIHPQVREWRWGSEVKSRVVDQVVGGGHVLAELLLQTKQAERGGRVRVVLWERTTAGQATAGGGGGHGWRNQGRVWTERRSTFNY